MIKVKINILYIALGIAIIVSIPPNNFVCACTCWPPGTAKEELANSDYVFQGKVTTIIPIGISSYSVSFTIIRLWKGMGFRSITVKEINCPSYLTSSLMEVGKEYIIFAKGTIPDINFGLCSRKIDSPYINQEIEELGDGYYPTMDLPIYYRQEILVSWLTLISAIGIVILCITIICVGIIKKKRNNKNIS